MSPHLDPGRSVDPILELSAALAPRYRLERELGRGATTTAYLAQAADGGRPVVIKLLRPSLTAAVGAERFVSELFTATRFRHASVVPILDAAALELETGMVALYYVVPFLEGESLRTRLEREGLLPIAEALRYAAELAGALAAVHAQGLVHGDMRRENVLLTSSGALLADLGLARALAEVRPAGDQAGDIRGLGRVLYEMLGGERPAGSPPSRLRAARPSVPEDVELMVGQMLASRPDDRQGAAGFAAPLAAAAESAARTPTSAGLTTGERVAARQRVSPRWGFFALALLAVLGVTLWLRYTTPATARPAVAVPARPTSVAVLPLVNASPDSADEYLSDGLTEELISDLGRVPGLRVTGASSSFALGGRVEDAQRAGTRLGAGAVLEGSARQAAGRLRVTVHLVSVREGFDLWSETYERDARDIFAVEHEIVRGVAGALRRPQPAATGAPTASLDAYALYLRGRRAARQAGPEPLARAMGLFQEAVALDSGFALAWSGLAETWLGQVVGAATPPREAMPRAAAAAERALALEPTLAGAHTALGVVRFLYDWKWDAAETEFQRALALNPNLASADRWYAHLLVATGRPDAALARSRRAVELEPADPTSRLQLGRYYLFTGLLSEAESELDLGRRLDSTRGGRFADATALLLGLLAERRGDYPLAESRYRAALTLAPEAPSLLTALGRVHALAGRPEEARALLQRLDSLSAVRYVSPFDLALVADGLGDRRRAFAWLDAALADRAASLVDLATDPRLERLRGDRRFARIARAVGLPPSEGGDYNPPTSKSAPRPPSP